MLIPSWLSRIEKPLYRRGLLGANQLSLPDFLGIGAQKSGTTWLYNNLVCHPGIYMPERKELHYFDRNYHQPLSSYAKNFLPGKGKLRGEITPAYIILPEHKVSFIRKVMPDLKILLLLRNPVERTWSHALMNLVLIPKKDFSSVKIDDFIRHFQREGSLRRSNYLESLAVWESLFPKQQFLISFFDRIAEEPRELLAEIFTFLGVSTQVDWESFPYRNKFNAFSQSEKSTDRMPPECREYLTRLYREDIEKLYQHFGDPVKNWRC